MSEPAENLRTIDSLQLTQAIDQASAHSVRESLDNWDKHLSNPTTVAPAKDIAENNIPRVFIKQDTIVDYKPVEVTRHSFALGADYLTAGKHTVRAEQLTSDDTVNGAGNLSQQNIELSRGIQNIKDLQEYGTGIGIGIQNSASETLQFLSRRNSVNNLLQNTGRQLTHAIDYYTKQPGRLQPDTRATLNTIGQSTIRTFGHPLSPRVAGEYTGQALTFFLPMGASKVLSEEGMAAYGGESALKALGEDELSSLKLTRIEPDEVNLAPRVADLQLKPEVIAGAIQDFEKTGKVSSEGIEQVGRYLRLFEDPRYPGHLVPENEAMLNRLIKGDRSPTDLRFYHHELVEAKFMTEDCSSLREAHFKALNYQGIKYEPGCETKLYHTDVIKGNDSITTAE